MLKYMNPTRLLYRSLALVGTVWSRLWFKERSTIQLELIRIGIGGVLLTNYGLATPHLFSFWGDDGLMPRSLAMQGLSPWVQSVFFYFSAPWQLSAFHAFFLGSCAALMLGWRTSVIKWVVLLGQLSYYHRDPNITYGVDHILASLLLILCVAPIGKELSLDSARAMRGKGDLIGNCIQRPYASAWAGACLRLIQLQMAIIFFHAGIAKSGTTWWDGDAVWDVFSTNEYYQPRLLDLLAHHYWLVNIATYASVLIELSYPFLIWQRRSRPYILTAAILLHLQIAIFMHLFYFSLVMVIGHLSFLRTEWLARFRAASKRVLGEIDLVYDRTSIGSARLANWFSSFDGFGQIRLREINDIGIPSLPNRTPTGSICIALSGDCALCGIKACRYLGRRIPGLWLQLPLFALPGISRLTYGFITTCTKCKPHVLASPQQNAAVAASKS
jgi:hypothetical protein